MTAVAKGPFVWDCRKFIGLQGGEQPHKAAATPFPIQFVLLAVLSSAARKPRASLIASSLAQKCMKISRGCSSSMWLWIAVTSIPAAFNSLMTGLTRSEEQTFELQS